VSEETLHDEGTTPELTAPPEGDLALEARDILIAAVTAAARYHGKVLDRDELRIRPDEALTPAHLVEWVRGVGLWAKADRLSFRQLLKLKSNYPVVLLFRDGSAGLWIASNPQRGVVYLRDPRAPESEEPVPVDALRLERLWGGEVLLIRPERTEREEDAPFNLGWLARLVFRERKFLRDIGLASLALSFLTIVPPLMVMAVIDRVLSHHSMSTLTLLTVLVAMIAVFETLLGFARREIIAVLAARVDTRLNLHIFNRLLGLSISYFERHPAGYTIHRLSQIWRLRDFMTGRLLSTFLDMFTLLVLLPVLFILSAWLSWMVLAGAVLITMVILVFLPAMRRAIGRVVRADIEKGTVMIETVHGIRTVKSLAIEPQQRDLWDAKVANSSRYRLEAARLGNWPATLVTPIERFVNTGVLLVGAYFIISGSSQIQPGALIAFMLLGGRVAQPLISLARMIEDVEEVRTSVGEVASVLNQPPEVRSAGEGLRPRFQGAISFENVTFTYPGSPIKALDDVTFHVPAGTMLGLVGRSGSGKSTITRLLQGINREYEGYVKIDGVDLREINLAHLRRSFGVVLQDNFLFRGTIRENLIAGRPGLTLDDVVRAARLAGAEEFIERLPQGYETFIEEGSPNLSGGQRQRLAIARALINDPRILILDEATSALDPESEALVNANLQRIARGRTMVIVSHRLSSLTECDAILVLDKGRVVDMGPHRELVERCAIYRQLWLQQNRHLQAGQTRRPTTMPPELATGE
jgi:subfamily B ATP-binding cassette protein HlyB/CyaB